MEYAILAPFDYSPDGLTVERLKKGDRRAIRDELVDGLKAAGLVADAEAPQSPADKKAAAAAAKAEADAKAKAAADTAAEADAKAKAEAEEAEAKGK